MRSASLQGSAAALAARLTAASVARPRATAAAALLGLGALLAGAVRSRSEVGYAAYFGPQSPEVAQLSAFLDEFESGFHMLIVFSCRGTPRCQRIDEPWALDFLERLHDAADRLPNVRRTWSALNAPIVVGPLETRALAQRVGSQPGSEARPSWRLDPAWRDLMAAGLAQRDFGQTVVSADGRSAGVVVELQSIASQPMRATVHGALAMLPAFERELGSELQLAGDPVWTVMSADTLDRDSIRLTLLMFAVMLALLYALFRDPWLAALPVLAVGAVTGAVRGLGVWLGLPQTSLLAALPPLLVVIAVAGSIHLLAAVLRAGEEQSAPPAELLVRAAREVGPGCFWSTFTTAVGFGSFLWSDLESFRDFGLLAAIGVGSGFLLTFTLLPALLLLRMRRGALRSRSPCAVLSHEILGAISDTVARYPRFVLCATTAGFALLGLGTLRLHYANDFGFGEGSFVVRSLRAIEANFRKPMTTEVVVTLPPGRQIWDAQTLWLLERIERIFGDEPSTGQVWSVLDLLEDAHRVDFGRAPESFESLVASARREMALVASSEHARWFWSESSSRGGGGGDRARVSVDRAWLDDAAQGPYVARVTADLAALQHQPGAQGYRVELAGGLVLADRFVSQLRNTQWRSFGSAFAVVAATLGFLLRETPGLALRAIAANMLPVVALVGLMGWAGVGVDPATAMVGAILLVLADDETIHLTLAYRDGRAAGRSAAESLALAIRSVGEPLLITGLCLALGFSVLLFSEWGGLVGFGLMASLGVALLLAGGLLFLPASLLAPSSDAQRALSAHP